MNTTKHFESLFSITACGRHSDVLVASPCPCLDVAVDHQIEISFLEVEREDISCKDSRRVRDSPCLVLVLEQAAVHRGQVEPIGTRDVLGRDEVDVWLQQLVPPCDTGYAPQLQTTATAQSFMSLRGPNRSGFSHSYQLLCGMTTTAPQANKFFSLLL